MTPTPSKRKTQGGVAGTPPAVRKAGKESAGGARRLHDALNDLSIYLPVTARVAAMKPMTRLETVFTVELPGGLSLGHEPGQFVEVSVFGVGEAPISISSSPSRSNGTFELCVRKAGEVTAALHALHPGDSIGVRGPFGHGFPVQQFYGKDILFAPGGLGLAPLRSLINEVLDDRRRFGRVMLLYGAKHPSELLFMDEVEAWRQRGDLEVHVTVDRPDEDWTGNVGVITTLFPKVQVHPRNTVAVSVGPPVMYRFVLIELLAKGIPEGNIWLSLERRMKCGVGKCGHCQMNHVFTCQEGPAFSYDRIKPLEEAL
jgi:NAD(P)H-flavin reductase